MGIDPFSIIVIAVGAGFLGSVVTLLNGWLKALRAVNQPQKVVHTTDKTPGEIVAAARMARFGLRTFYALSLTIVWAAYAYFDTGGAMNFARAVRNVVLVLLEMLIQLLQALHDLLASFG